MIKEELLQMIDPTLSWGPITAENVLDDLLEYKSPKEMAEIYGRKRACVYLMLRQMFPTLEAKPSWHSAVLSLSSYYWDGYREVIRPIQLQLDFSDPRADLDPYDILKNMS